MITLVAGAGLSVHWQGRAGVTQQALAVLLIVLCFATDIYECGY